MKKCAFCSEPATVHITDLTHGKQQELHLCGSCYEKNEKSGDQKLQQVEQFVKGLITAQLDRPAGALAELACPYCGTRYMEFYTQGRLGCPADYEAFLSGILPVLERIHGSTEHRGKSPRRSLPAAAHRGELIRLRRQLQAAIDREQFEEAARLRDLMRARESGHEPE